MKTITILLLFTALVTQTCNSQTKTILLNYKAETRGFSYTLLLENGLLQESNNGINITKNLSAKDLNAVEKQLEEINFEEIKSNLSIEDSAVDKAIPGYFEVEFNNNKYLFEFSHHNLPEEIADLIDSLKKLLH
jgi:hypothetical protein